MTSYLNSVKGHLARRRSRQRRRLLIHCPIEPKSKKANPKDELKFQRRLLDALKKFQRRYFRAPVALELDFFLTQNDPPAIQNLVKNYLDLLQEPANELHTGRKRLILDDDTQVEYLAARYHISPTRTNPGIWIKVAPYSNLTEDIALLEQVRSGDIETDSIDTIGWDDLIVDIQDEDHADAWDHLHDFEEQKTEWESRFGKDVYEAWYRMHLMDAQEQFLKMQSLSSDDIIHLLAPDCSSKALHDIYVSMREMIISPWFAIDLKHSNLEKIGKSKYKRFVREAIRNFRERFAKLFPLYAKVGVTILVQPHAGDKRNKRDLDNLAKMIIPAVNDELKPPSDLISNIDTTKITNPKIKKTLEEQQAMIRRMPKHSVTHYQVVRMPQLAHDNKNGFVRLLLEPGKPFDTFWRRIEGLADKWQELAERG